MRDVGPLSLVTPKELEDQTIDQTISGDIEEGSCIDIILVWDLPGRFLKSASLYELLECVFRGLGVISALRLVSSLENVFQLEATPANSDIDMSRFIKKGDSALPAVHQY